jgi:hypothetical protein
MIRPLTTLAAAMLLASCGTIFPAVKDHGMGTWRMDPARSSFRPGPAPKTLTARFEPAPEGGVRLRTEAVLPNGQVATTAYDARLDGKDYPLTGSPMADAVTLRRVDARRVERSDKKNGTTVMNQSRVISEDGRTMLVVMKGATPAGDLVENWIVFTRDEGAAAPSKP